MMLKGRVLGLLLGVIALVAIGASGVLYIGQMKERQLRIEKEQQLARAIAERDDLTEQLQTVRQAKEASEAELGRVKVRLDQTAKDLAEEQAAKDALAQSVDDRQQEIDRLTKDLTSIRTERASLESQVARLTAEQKQLQDQLAQSQKEKDDLQAKATQAAARPTVELEPVMVGQSQQPTAAAGSAPVEFDPGVQLISATGTEASSGQVLVVNREYDFVVVNLGRNHGLQIGQEFQIQRGPDVLGRVKVEKVYDELSAAAILPQSQKDKIREGDQVTAM